MARYSVSTNNQNEALQIMKAPDYLWALAEIDNWLRRKTKWNDMLLTGKIYAEAREEFYDILQRFNISLDELE